MEGDEEEADDELGDEADEEEADEDGGEEEDDGDDEEEVVGMGVESHVMTLWAASAR